MKLSKVFDEVVAICGWFWPSLLFAMVGITAYYLGVFVYGVDVGGVVMSVFPVVVVLNIVAWLASMFGGP